MSCRTELDKRSSKVDQRQHDLSSTSLQEGTNEKYGSQEEVTGNSDSHETPEDTQETRVGAYGGHDSGKSAASRYHGSIDGCRAKKGKDFKKHPFGELKSPDVEGGDFLYVFGGCKGEREIPVERFNIARDEWEIVESEGDVPIAGCSYEASVGVWHGDAVWLSGGLRNGRPTDKFYRYDPREKTWQEKTPMIEPRVRHGMAVIKNKLHAFGGFNGQEVRSTAEYYDEQEEAWKRCERRMLQARSQFGVTFYNGRIVIAGGEFRGKALKSVECFDGQDWRTHKLIFLPEDRRGLRLFATDKTVFVVGGNSGTEKTILWYDYNRQKFRDTHYVCRFISYERNLTATLHKKVIYVIWNAPGNNIVSSFASFSTTGEEYLSSRYYSWKTKPPLISKRLFPAIVAVQL